MLVSARSPLVEIGIMVGSGGGGGRNLDGLIALIADLRRPKGWSLSDPCDHLLIGVPSFSSNHSCQFLEEDWCWWSHSSCSSEDQGCEGIPLNLSNRLVIYSLFLSFMLLVHCLHLLVPVARRKWVESPFCSAKDRASLSTPSAFLWCISLLSFFTSLESLFNSASMCDSSISSPPRIEFFKGSSLSLSYCIVDQLLPALSQFLALQAMWAGRPSFFLHRLLPVVQWLLELDHALRRLWLVVADAWLFLLFSLGTTTCSWCWR